MEIIDDQVNFVGFVFAPSQGFSGGILLVWNSMWHLIDAHIGSYSVLVLIRHVQHNAL